MPNSKKSPKPAHNKPHHNKRLQYIAPKPKKPTIWTNLGSGLVMLRYRPEELYLKGSPIARRIKSPATVEITLILMGATAVARVRPLIRLNVPKNCFVARSSSVCIVAPVYAAVEKFPRWSIPVIQNIFEIADEVHRVTVQQLRLRPKSSFPIQCVCPTFFVNYNKVTILVRQDTGISAPPQGGVTSSLEDDQVHALERLMSDNHGVVLLCHGKPFAFWRDKGKFFALIPDGLEDFHSNMPLLLKGPGLRSLVEFCLKNEHGNCSVYCLKVVDKSRVPMTIENINAEFKLSESEEAETARLATKNAHHENEDEVTPPPAEAAPSKAQKHHKKKNEEVDTSGEFAEDMILRFSSDYKELDSDRGVLMGKEYCKDPERLLHTVVAAAVFLHHFPANLWTSAIIHDIIKLGRKIFLESEDEDLLENEDWADRIKLPIKFMKKNLSARFDKRVFGKVCSVEKDVLGLEQGLMKFFQNDDTGLVIGPQMVLVWRQKNTFFMFDPKERDELGRKWTRIFSAQLGSTATAGSACISWFRNPKKLSEVYTENIALKHRKDFYRIVKVQFFEAATVPEEEEGDWFRLSTNTWALVGTKTLCDYSFAEDNHRPGKALCIGVSALITAMETPPDEWETGTTIDNVLADGIELFKQSLPNHDQEKAFSLDSILKNCEIKGRRIRIHFVHCAVKGTMLAQGRDKDSFPLKEGLTEFFNTANYGVFTVKDISLGVWFAEDNFFYIFFPYEKLFGFPPQCQCDNDKTLPPMGLANAMKFKTINDLYAFLTSCLNTRESDEYCLSPIDIQLSDAAGRPPTREYEEFGESGGIMRPFKNLHEGHEMFGVRADKQTLANLLIALGYNRINSSIEWNKEDLADILQIGDKIFCKIFMALPECQARDYQLQWEDVVPVIGMNKFMFTREPIEGVVELAPEMMGEEFEHEMFGHEDFAHEEGAEAQDELFVPPQGSPREGSKDLRGILQTWDKKKRDYQEAVIETSFFKIAIWKRENMYFVFDPKASGENGELTERRMEIGKDRCADENFPIPEQTDDLYVEPCDTPLYLEKRTYTEFDNDGTAYTAWFTDFEEFYKHIAAKTPEDYKYGKFTLHDLQLTNEPVGADDFQFQMKPGFRAITAHHEIIRGSMTQNSHGIVNRNKLEFANCVVAIAFGKITPTNKMSTTLLDVILKYGDRLYSKSLNLLRKASREEFCSIDKLSLDYISSMFSIYKIRFNWKVNTITKGNFYVNELKRATGRLGNIEAGAAIILSHKDYLMAIWKSEGSLLLYDPFDTSPTGILAAANGLPSLQKFGKLDNLLSYIVTKFACVLGNNTFTMYSITMKSSPVEELNFASVDAEANVDRCRLISYIPKDQEMFQSFQNDMKILKSPLGSNNLPQQSLALGALIHSRLQFVDLWDYNVSQRICFLAKYILNKTDCELKGQNEPISFDCIRSSFAVENDVLCHFTVKNNMQGPIYTTKRAEIVGVNLQNALTMSFKLCQHVIITMPGLGRSFALWKENGKFYLFGVDSVEPEVFVIAAPTLAHLFDILLRGTSPVAHVNNWYELRSISLTRVPIKESICKPLKVTKSMNRGPFSTKDGEHYFMDSKSAHFFDHVAEKPESSTLKSHNKEFSKVSNGIEILYSNAVLKSHRFYGTKDFFSSLLAACVECSALSRVKPPTLWTKKTLEKLLTAGANLYVNTVAVKGTCNLVITDFKGNLYVSDFKLEVCPGMPAVQSASKEDLMMCLPWILRKYQTAYLYTESFCFTIILENNDCFLYYPGSMQSLCSELRCNCSCLIRFCSVSDLLEKLLSNCEIALCENICIGPICVFKL